MPFRIISFVEIEVSSTILESINSKFGWKKG